MKNNEMGRDFVSNRMPENPGTVTDKMSQRSATVADKMSQRLLTVANMLGEISGDEAVDETPAPGMFSCVADVGCDHGYVSMYLVQSGIAGRAIAMDVRKGPLAMAAGNIEIMGLSDRIETRLSDGLSELGPGEADSLVIAGMGGKLMISILEKKSLSSLGIKSAVLQPQSDIDEFRQFLRDEGLIIVDERIVLEDGKYYFPMKVEVRDDNRVGKAKGRAPVRFEDMPGPAAVSKALEITDSKALQRICNRYGEMNILRKDPLLEKFLLHGREVCGSILQSLDEISHSDRFNEVRQEAEDIDLLLKMF
ncbi:MAG: SAM-dependent methyltransferase [Lachnospiraceae bacterium]|nr:SAM-dependent methyltransferase [Lachnospiraceae bacterium]